MKEHTVSEQDRSSSFNFLRIVPGFVLRRLLGLSGSENIQAELFARQMTQAVDRPITPGETRRLYAGPLYVGWGHEAYGVGLYRNPTNPGIRDLMRKYAADLRDPERRQTILEEIRQFGQVVPE